MHQWKFTSNFIHHFNTAKNDLDEKSAVLIVQSCKMG